MTENDLACLRSAVGSRMEEKRFLHTLGVEKMTAEIAATVLPDAVFEARIAALLHDITKDMPIPEQVALLKENGVFPTEEDIASPQVMHSFSAPYLAKRDYPAFVTDRILHAIDFHTTGGREMSVFDEILFVADYIEETRPYPSCIAARESYRQKIRDGVLPVKALHEAVLDEIGATLVSLEKRGLPVHSRLLLAKETVLTALSSLSRE